MDVISTYFKVVTNHKAFRDQLNAKLMRTNKRVSGLTIQERLLLTYIAAHLMTDDEDELHIYMFDITTLLNIWESYDD